MIFSLILNLQWSNAVVHDARSAVGPVPVIRQTVAMAGERD